MEIIMATRGRKFVEFLKEKRLQHRGKDGEFNDTKFAKDLGIPYPTLKRWLASSEVDRIDIENWLALDLVYGKELTDYLRRDDSGQGD